ITDKAGLSVGLGALLAGLIISESEYNHQATSIILPFRELFTTFFFISIGMMLDLGFFIRHIGIIFIILLAVIIVKSFIAGVAVMILKYPARTIILTGLSLFQIGEFAFILSKVGIENHLLTEETKQYFLAVSIFSMLATPFIMMFSERIANWITGFKTVRRLSLKSAKRANTDMEARSERYENHLIIIGYGINGSNLAKAAQFSHIPYVVVELNAATVQREKEKGIPILYGDATQTHILNEVNVAGSRAVVIVISDSAATKTIIKNIRFISQSVYLLVRTRFVKDTQELLDMGADNVIPEEFETSIQIFSFVLQNFLVPEDDIEKFTHIIRDDNYDLFKNQKTRRKTFQPAQLPDFNITCMRINTDSGRFVGHPLKEMNLRANYGINILAVSRGENMIEQLDPNDVLQQDDIIYVNGKPENIEKFQRLIN
ncbi:MAG: cation:proton antiporter, partial [Petrimonas sp.]|nr:cation:proton antiporter [Petrimonas sp.]